MQLLINELFKIPTEVKEDTVVFKLPKPVTRLPREKPVSKKKPKKCQTVKLTNLNNALTKRL